MFGNPVPGVIRPKALALPPPWQFQISSTFADHVKAGRPPGIDIFNGRGGDPVYAAAAGKVVARFKDPGNGALIIRIDHGTGYTTGYAHIASLALVNVGQLVKRGQKIAAVGRTGTPGYHLHFGVNHKGVEIDGWPLLDQNRVAWLDKADVNIRLAPATDKPVHSHTVTTSGLHIIRSDGKDLGLAANRRAFAGWVTGGTYTVGGTKGTLWAKVWLDSNWRYVAKPLIRVSL